MYLTNLSWDKKAYPVYISTGNLPLTRRNRTGFLALLLLELLPVPPKLASTSSTNNLQRQINADTLQGIFQLIFEPVKAMALEGVSIDCADGKIWRCFPILSGWIADHTENVLLHGKSNACPKCEVPTEDLGIPSVPHRARDYTRYDRYQRENETHHTPRLNIAQIHLTHLVSRLGKMFLTGFPKFHHQLCTRRICYIQFIYDSSSIWWTGYKDFSTNLPDNKRLTMPAKLCPPTLDSLTPKRPIRGSQSGKVKRWEILGVAYWEFSLWH